MVRGRPPTRTRMSLSAETLALVQRTPTGPSARGATGEGRPRSRRRVLPDIRRVASIRGNVRAGRVRAGRVRSIADCISPAQNDPASSRRAALQGATRASAPRRLGCGQGRLAGCPQRLVVDAEVAVEELSVLAGLEHGEGHRRLARGNPGAGSALGELHEAPRGEQRVLAAHLARLLDGHVRQSAASADPEAEPGCVLARSRRVQHIPGEVVAVGERHHLPPPASLHELCIGRQRCGRERDGGGAARQCNGRTPHLEAPTVPRGGSGVPKNHAQLICGRVREA